MSPRSGSPMIWFGCATGLMLQLGAHAPSYTMSPRWGSHDLVRLRLGAHAFNSGLSPRAIRCRPVGAPMIWFGCATGLMPSTRGSRPELYDVAPLGLPCCDSAPSRTKADGTSMLSTRAGSCILGGALIWIGSSSVCRGSRAAPIHPRILARWPLVRRPLGRSARGLQPRHNPPRAAAKHPGGIRADGHAGTAAGPGIGQPAADGTGGMNRRNWCAS